MGLEIKEYTILDGLVTLTDLYGNARDIRITKEDVDFSGPIFIIECLFYIYKGEKVIEVMHIRNEYNNDFLTKTWGNIYDLIKERLDNKGIKYSDKI